MVSIEDVTSDDEGINDQDMNGKSNIQLGFSEPIQAEDANVIAHRSPRWWKDWDGGQMGGRPSWLEPKDLPKKSLTCLSCQGTMQFLCQLYVPLDNLPRAFHRSFYIFGCPKCCSANNTDGQGVRVLRVQLPLDNPYYPPENAPIKGWKKHLPETWGVNLCEVCGQRATGKCPLQKVWFCGKDHQKEYKQSQSKSQINKSQPTKMEEEEEAALVEESPTAEDPKPAQDISPDFLPSVYAASELVVEEEPNAGAEQDEENDDDDDEIERPTMFPSNAAGADEQDSDEDIEQEDLNEMVTGKASLDQTSTKDPATNAFYRRIQDRKDASQQCLRYTMEWRHQYDTTMDNDNNNTPDDRDKENQDDSQPLWIQSGHQPATIPPCPNCQAPRAFEFQLMPQMLHYLHANHNKPQSNDKSEQAQKNETAKQALIAADSIIANSDPSQIPPSFAEAKAKAMQALQQDLFQQDSQRVEWGVVAIYTCTKSCNAKGCDDALGVYQEEYAWLQPALDVM